MASENVIWRVSDWTRHDYELDFRPAIKKKSLVSLKDDTGPDTYRISNFSSLLLWPTMLPRNPGRDMLGSEERLAFCKAIGYASKIKK